MNSDESIREVYNIKESIPWKNAGKLKKTGQRSISLKKLSSLNETVPFEDVINSIQWKPE